MALAYLARERCIDLRFLAPSATLRAGAAGSGRSGVPTDPGGRDLS